MRSSFLTTVAIFVLAALLFTGVHAAGGNAVRTTVITGNAENAVDDALIRKALDLIADSWTELARDNRNDIQSPYVDVRSTRIVRLRENPVREGAENKKQTVEELSGVDCIIEFLLYTNYVSDTYISNTGRKDSVIVYKNGKMEVSDANLLQLVRGKYFLSDFSGIIEEIVDYGSEYNGRLFN